MSSISTKTDTLPTDASPSWVQRHPLVAYFAIAFIGTWAAVIPLALSTGFNLITLPDVVTILLFFLSPYLGPMLGAVIVTRITEGGAGVRKLLKRIVQWRVGVVWYLAAIFIMLLIWLAGFSILYNGAPLRELMANPVLLGASFLQSILIGIFIPSLGEEVGWRGFALPRLQIQYGPVLGSLILGSLHAAWHLPALMTLFMGPLKAEEYLPFMLTAVAGTFVYTWVFNNARGSILIAILMHASTNAAVNAVE